MWSLGLNSGLKGTDAENCAGRPLSCFFLGEQTSWKTSQLIFKQDRNRRTCVTGAKQTRPTDNLKVLLEIMHARTTQEVQQVIVSKRT